MKDYFLCGLDVDGRSCLVIGADDEAVDKAIRLSRCGARVTLVSPQIPTPSAAMLAAAGVAVDARAFNDGDLVARFLVFFSDRDDVAAARRLRERCSATGVLLCAIDQPQFCDVVNVSTFEKGRLKIGISTGGAAPALGRKIREGLDRGLAQTRIDDYLDQLADLRRRLEETVPDRSERRRRLIAAVKDFEFDAAVRLPESSEAKPG